MANLKYPAEMSALHLPPGVIDKIKTCLDTGPQGKNWQAFIEVLSDKYIFSAQDVEVFARQVQSPMSSPTTKLLLHLDALRFTVADLVRYLDAMRLENLQLELRNHEPICLLSEPEPRHSISQGDSLYLTVEATGFPYPRFKWFRKGHDGDVTFLQGDTDGTYHKKDLSRTDSGVYYCMVFNSHKPDYTHDITVYVTPDLRDFDVEKPSRSAADITRKQNIYNPSGVVLQLWTESKVSEEATQSYFHVADSYNNTGPVPLDTGPPLSIAPIGEGFEIIRQPKSCTVELDGSAVFECRIVGSSSVSYRWYKDSKRLEGENNPQLFLSGVDASSEGHYQCRVWDSSMDILSFSAFLRVGGIVDPEYSLCVNTATDKIALLIGNYDYVSAEPLNAPKTDVQVLSDSFRSMDFKVVSLLNLTLSEMIAAVNYFTDLAGEAKGVYCVFYFCGHGFQEHGQIYLVPFDAVSMFSINDCLNTDYVMSRMQEKNPTLCALILDCCRISNSALSKDMPEQCFPKPVGNVIYLYATTAGMRAYEYESGIAEKPSTNPMLEPNGILVKYLQPYLCKRKTIEKIFSDIRVDIRRDPNLCSFQIPEVRTNLQNPHVSLADPVVFRGQTLVFTKRTHDWQNAHTKPKVNMVSFPELGVDVEVDYQVDFSNVLSVYLTVKKCEQMIECQAWLTGLPLTVSAMDASRVISQHPVVTTKTTIHDLQRLQAPLHLTVSLTYMKTAGRVEMAESQPLDLGYPLVSALKLWQTDCAMNETTATSSVGSTSSMSYFSTLSEQGLTEKLNN